MQRPAYEWRISVWISDVCSSDLQIGDFGPARHLFQHGSERAFHFGELLAICVQGRDLLLLAFELLKKTLFLSSGRNELLVDRLDEKPLSGTDQHCAEQNRRGDPRPFRPRSRVVNVQRLQLADDFLRLNLSAPSSSSPFLSSGRLSTLTLSVKSDLWSLFLSF